MLLENFCLEVVIDSIHDHSFSFEVKLQSDLGGQLIDSGEHVEINLQLLDDPRKASDLLQVRHHHRQGVRILHLEQGPILRENLHRFSCPTFKALFVKDGYIGDGEGDVRSKLLQTCMVSLCVKRFL